MTAPRQSIEPIKRQQRVALASSLDVDVRQLHVESVLRLKQRDWSLNGLNADIAAHTSSVGRLATNGSVSNRWHDADVAASRPFRGCSRAVKRLNRAFSLLPCTMIPGVEFIVSMRSSFDEYECVGECRDRLRAADFTTRFACFIRCLMNSVPHDFVTVDMRGLKAALVACARERRVSVSVVVRDAVIRALPSEQAAPKGSQAPIDTDVPSGTVKVSIRLTTNEVHRLDLGAKAAGLSRAAFLSGLIEGVNVLSSGGRRDHLAALISSSSELSTLSRNIRHLADLLRRSESRAAQEYRAMLDTLASDVNGHLNLAGDVLTQMLPAFRVVKTKDARSWRARRRPDV